LPQTVPAAVQVLPGRQQVCPTPPHASHVREVPIAPVQTMPGPLQMLLPQQGWPGSPQRSQLMPPSTRTHPLLAAVHSPLPTLTTFPRPQHVWPIAPHAVYGTWKGAVRTVDKTKNPPAITVTPDADPAKNDWKLGSGADPVPAGLADEGYGAEIVWNVDALNLTPGRVYRVQMMVHDGDQNSAGGDTGESCATIFIH